MIPETNTPDPHDSREVPAGLWHGNPAGRQKSKENGTEPLGHDQHLCTVCENIM